MQRCFQDYRFVHHAQETSDYSIVLFRFDINDRDSVYWRQHPLKSITVLDLCDVVAVASLFLVLFFWIQKKRFIFLHIIVFPGAFHLSHTNEKLRSENRDAESLPTQTTRRATATVLIRKLPGAYFAYLRHDLHKLHILHIFAYFLQIVCIFCILDLLLVG